VAPSVQRRKVWLTPTAVVPCSNAAKSRNPLKFARVPQTTRRSQPLVGRSSSYYGDIWRTHCCLTSFWATVCKTVRPIFSYRSCPLSVCTVCVSVTFVHCGQTVARSRRNLACRYCQVGLGPGHIVLEGDPAPLPKGAQPPQFSAHICCGQMAPWIKMSLGMELDLGQGDFVLDGDHAHPSPKGGRAPPHFRPMFIATKRLDA